MNVDIHQLAGAAPPMMTPKQQGDSDIGRDGFLKLLVTQMRNQDPINPMDSREFITQLSQLTGVDRLVQINEQMESLETAVVSVANAQAADLTGKTVTAEASSLRL
jgi:flagellar basal-body rod modification protein FlgD